MRVVGEGRELWHVEVVLWTDEPDDDTVEALLDAVAASTVTIDTGEETVRDVEPAWSYDIDPPEGGVGVACWVRADSVGGAAEQGWTVVRDAARAVLGADIQLWDLRVIPRAAILNGTQVGTTLTF